MSTVLLTVLSGVLTYIAGQLFIKLVAEPVMDFRKTLGDIANTIAFRSRYLHNPGVLDPSDTQKVSEELRLLSARLRSHLYLIPAYATIARVFKLPSRESVLKASKSLATLSSGVYPSKDPRIYESNTKTLASVCDQLALYFPDEERWS